MKKHILKKAKFPKIYRFITDRLLKPSNRLKIAMIALLSFIMLYLIGISSFDLYTTYQEKLKLDLERQKIISKIQYWQGIVSKYKDYRDAYFQLAILEYRLRDFDKSKHYLDKALALDPNFEKGRELEKILGVSIKE